MALPGFVGKGLFQRAEEAVDIAALSEGELGKVRARRWRPGRRRRRGRHGVELELDLGAAEESLLERPDAGGPEKRAVGGRGAVDTSRHARGGGAAPERVAIAQPPCAGGRGDVLCVRDVLQREPEGARRANPVQLARRQQQLALFEIRALIAIVEADA